MLKRFSVKATGDLFYITRTKRLLKLESGLALQDKVIKVWMLP
jgi:hypothetical protein